MRILIDENLPRHLKSLLPDHDVSTVQEMGWAGIRNGLLLDHAETQFDVFLTADKNLRRQQSLADRDLAVIVFPSNRLPIVQSLKEALHTRLQSVRPGQVIEL